MPFFEANMSLVCIVTFRDGILRRVVFQLAMGHATRAMFPLSFFVGFSEVVVWFFHVLLLGIWEHETLDQRFHSDSHKQEIHQVESMCKI